MEWHSAEHIDQESTFKPKLYFARANTQLELSQDAKVIA